jgi:hypothetical protein
MTQSPEATAGHEWVERLMPRDVTVDRPDRVLVICTVEDYMTAGHKVWENSSLCGGTTQPLGWFTRKIVDLPLGGGGGVATLCIRRGSSASRVSLPFYLLAAERLPPQSASFALMDYKVPGRAYIKKMIKEGRNPLLPNYVGHIGRKPVYEADGPLESMDDILVRTKRGVREVTTEEWRELKGYPLSWDTTDKDRRRIIQEPSLHFWSVVGDAFAPTLIQPESKMEPNDEDDGISVGLPPLSPRPPWEGDSSDDESEGEFYYPSSEHLELPPSMDASFEWDAPDLQEGGEWF